MAKHEKSFVDFDKPYEQNLIGLRGIIIFGIGLFILIVVTFGLMWVLQDQMEKYAAETKDTKSPMMMNDREQLPPEPRLQSAPGFGVDSVNGRTNLELNEPQAEWRVLQGQWKSELENGQKDAKSGTIVTLPIDEAKKKFLEQSGKVQQTNQQQTPNIYEESHRFASYQSSGRMMGDKIR
jgi:hypothetical protein